MEKTDVEELLEKQRKWCFKDFLQIDNYNLDRAKFYKNVLGAVFSVVGISVMIFTGLVAWSYKPIQDIAALKAEVRLLNNNVDKLLRLNGRQAMEDIMDMLNVCPECNQKGSYKLDKVKRKCIHCGAVYSTRSILEAEASPGKEESHKIAMNKNPVLDAR